VGSAADLCRLFFGNLPLVRTILRLSFRLIVLSVMPAIVEGLAIPPAEKERLLALRRPPIPAWRSSWPSASERQGARFARQNSTIAGITDST